MDNSEQNILVHHGIRGMKWGVRRYQRKDGSRTAAGKKRERDGASETDNSSDSTSKGTASKGTNSKKPLTTAKKISDLSDTELRNAINRMQMEKQLKNLVSEEVNKGQITTKEAIKKLATVAAVTTSIVTIASNSQQIKKFVETASKKAVKP